MRVYIICHSPGSVYAVKTGNGINTLLLFPFSWMFQAWTLLFCFCWWSALISFWWAQTFYSVSSEWRNPISVLQTTQLLYMYIYTYVSFENSMHKELFLKTSFSSWHILLLSKVEQEGHSETFEKVIMKWMLKRLP